MSQKEVEKIKGAFLSAIPNGASWPDVVRALYEVIEAIRQIAPEAVA